MGRLVDKANGAAGGRLDQFDEADVVAKRAGDGDVANGFHLFQRIDQTLILALLEGVVENFLVLRRGVLVNDRVMPTFRPIWVLVPQAVASMVSYLSRAKPGTLPNSSKPSSARATDAILVRPDPVRTTPPFAAVLAEDSLASERSYCLDVWRITSRNTWPVQ